MNRSIGISLFTRYDLLKNISLFIIASLILFTFIATYSVWPGSILTYILFSLAFNLLLYSAVKYQITVGYVFLAVVLWIGFWLKLSMHLLYPSMWMEPTGSFDFSKESFDELAIVSSVGAIGVFLAGFTFGSVKFSFNDYLQVTPSNFNRNLWIMGLALVVVTIFMNETYHVVQAFKPPPELGLPFHLQGLLNWYFGGGWGILLMLPFYASFYLRKDLNGVVLITLAGVLVSVSIFSRGVMVFQALIIFLSLLVYKKSLHKVGLKRLLQYITIIFLGICISVMVSMERRSSFFKNLPMENSSYSSSSALSSWFYIAKLPIERWVGLEGLMAISSYKGKGSELLVSRINEPRVVGEVDFYTHKVALNPTKDTKTVNYATPPGFIAFSYYSGSLWFVFVFTYLLALILTTSERIVLIISKNPFLASSIGFMFAVQLIHLGTGGLLGPIKIFLMSFTVALFIGYLEKIRNSRTSV